MSRHFLINEIFERFPRTSKGINRDGHHVVQIVRNKMSLYATLEKLSNADLEALAGQFADTINTTTKRIFNA